MYSLAVRFSSKSILNMHLFMKFNGFLRNPLRYATWLNHQSQAMKSPFCYSCYLHSLKAQNFAEGVKPIFWRCFSTQRNVRLSIASKHLVSDLKFIRRTVIRSSIILHHLNVRKFSLSSRFFQTRQFSSNNQDASSIILYLCSLVVFMLGVAYAAVPLYRIFCQATGLGGDPTIGHKIEQVETMKPIRERKIRVAFNADHHSSMQWNFKPSQSEITVVPGETALAFYTAKNPTDKPIVGIATYNVVPFQAGLYFNKIQCFCFEEQWLNPNEEVDMPVFFYIDPDYDDDPILANADDIILSYTFFKAEEGQTIPLPGFMKANSVANLNQIKEETTSN